jgi:hypothetical protein
MTSVVMAAPEASAQPEPKRAHPRLLLDAELRKAWKTSAGIEGSPVARAVRRCDQIGASTKEFDRDGYMGLDWCNHLQACLIAHAATGKDQYAATAMRYFTALIDDLQYVGDGKGGDQAAWRDSGYSIRALGPYAALAYDWLHDHKLMTEAVRKRARQRFASWTSWYLQKGYRARSPATNYQAGYLMAATLIAVAQAGEAGAAGTALWRHVVDELWRKDMTKAFEPGGVLDGGDWAEGWQYGPLSVAEYAVTLRVMRSFGVELEAAKTWPVDVLRRHVYALAPSDRVFVGGDTQTEEPYIEPIVFTLAGVALSDAAPMVMRSYAVAELDRLKLETHDFPLFDALARGTGVKPVPVPRASWPTWYVARGTSTLHARTRWDASAVWMVAQCTRTLDVDHFQPNAGNFVISRGEDNLIVDPSPYGSLSTLTGNAPTVDSPQLPPNYRPSQAYWSEATGFRWAHQTQRGVVAARCDYADQYKFQQRPSDVPMAVRDFVLVPRNQGSDATLVIADRADTTSAERELFLQFRTPGKWRLGDGGARTEVGRSSAVLTTLNGGGTERSGKAAKGKSAGAKGTVSSPTRKDCFNDQVTRGNCDAARLPVSDYRLKLRGPKPSVIQVIEVGDGKTSGGAVAITGPNYQGVAVAHERSEVAVLWAKAPGELSYQTKPGSTVVVHDAAPVGEAMRATAQRSGNGCNVTVSAGGTAAAAPPLVLQLDERCAVTEDAVATGSNAATGAVAATMPETSTGDQGATEPAAGPNETGAGATETAAGPNDGSPAQPVPEAQPAPRRGCCSSSTTAVSTLPTALLVGLALLLRRRRRSDARG